MSEFTIKPLSPDTWDDFAELAERHNGCWCAVHGSCWAEGGGCWCMRFQRSCAEKQAGEGNRARKERLVTEGRAHAALVFDGDVAVAWCEYGTPEELPNIYHRKEYEAGLDKLPDYRLTCFFVDKIYGVVGIPVTSSPGSPRPGVEWWRRTRRTPTDRRFRHRSCTTPPVASSSSRLQLRPAQGQIHCVMSKTVPRG